MNTLTSSTSAFCFHHPSRESGVFAGKIVGRKPCLSAPLTVRRCVLQYALNDLEPRGVLFIGPKVRCAPGEPLSRRTRAAVEAVQVRLLSRRPGREQQAIGMPPLGHSREK
jgi:hypothetical protein